MYFALTLNLSWTISGAPYLYVKCRTEINKSGCDKISWHIIRFPLKTMWKKKDWSYHLIVLWEIKNIQRFRFLETEHR